MKNYDRNRRRLLMRISGIGVWLSLSNFQWAIAQSSGVQFVAATPQNVQPEASASKNKEISLEAYEEWLLDVRKATEKLAEENGMEFQPEVLDGFNNKARKTLNENGYKIPKPPTNIQIY